MNFINTIDFSLYYHQPVNVLVICHRESKPGSERAKFFEWLIGYKKGKLEKMIVTTRNKDEKQEITL